VDGQAGRVRDLVARTHFENSMIDALLHREHTPYREVGHRAVAYTLERAGIAYTMDEVRQLVAQIVRLKPFPDVPRLSPPQGALPDRGALERRFPTCSRPRRPSTALPSTP